MESVVQNVRLVLYLLCFLRFKVRAMILSSCFRRLGLLALPLAFAAVTSSTEAQAQPAAKPAATAAKPTAAGSQAVQVATSGDWSVYTARAGKSKVCYALSQPKERLPAGLNRDPGYLFVSFRPAENVKGELAVVMGFGTKEDAGGEAVIGETSFALLSKGPHVWLKNAAEESNVVAAMERGQSLLIKVQSGRGNKVSDKYSLAGFTNALARARKECQ